MKTSIVFAMLLATLAGLGTIYLDAQNSEPPAKLSEEQEVRKLNAEEVGAFLMNDPKAMARVWSEDFVVTNPLNKFVNRGKL